jgi:hypothetical protein
VCSSDLKLSDTMENERLFDIQIVTMLKSVNQ